MIKWVPYEAHVQGYKWAQLLLRYYLQRVGQESLNMPSWITGSLPTHTALSFLSITGGFLRWKTTLPKSGPFQRISIFCLFGNTKAPPFLTQSKQFWNAIATLELSRENTEHVSSVSLYYSHFLPVLPHLQVFFSPREHLTCCYPGKYIYDKQFAQRIVKKNSC